MTAERFKLDFDDPRAVWIDDNSNDKSYTVINDTLKKKNIQEIVDLLNQLSDGNEQLKHRLAISEKANFVTTLEKENEQLKRENYELHKKLGDVE